MSTCRIALFADLHFGEDAWTDWGPRQDVNSVRVMSSVLDRGYPDFVVYLGDVVTANNIMVANASLYWDMAVSRARSRVARGMFLSPVIPPIQCPCEFQSKKTAASREHDACRSYLEGLSKAQVEWFRSKSHEIDPNSSVPELIFRHIPSKAYKKVAPGPGICKPCVGSMNMEKVAPQETEGVMELFGNGLLSSYGDYGDWPRGARIIKMIGEPFSAKSWIRIEDGNMHGEVVLSA